jgi:hypothetical protein
MICLALGSLIPTTDFLVTGGDASKGTPVAFLLESRALAAQQEKIPIPFGDELEAWLKAGATPGWMGRFFGGVVRFDLRFQPDRGYVPAFRFDAWPPAPKLSSLPLPKGAFGLDLHDQAVKDVDLKELAGMNHLQALRLNGTQITDDGLKELAALGSLQTLDMGRLPVTDAGLKHLAGLKKLQTLLLDGTRVTDAGLKELAGFRELQTLFLGNTQVTDKGTRELANLKSLKIIVLGGSRVTEAGVRQLKEALPGCRVVHPKWGDAPF